MREGGRKRRKMAATLFVPVDYDKALPQLLSSTTSVRLPHRDRTGPTTPLNDPHPTTLLPSHGIHRPLSRSPQEEDGQAQASPSTGMASPSWSSAQQH